MQHTSRNVLNIIRDAGYEPIVIDYQKEGWTKSQLLGLFAAANLTPRKALRTSKSPAEELGLLSDGVTDEVLVKAIHIDRILNFETHTRNSGRKQNGDKT